jgi:hypothetical protein
MLKKIVSCIALAFLCSCSFGQNKNIAATRAYCDHNRTVAATEAVSQLKPVLEDYIVDEVDRVSRSFVTNAYPVPIPITNTIYQITDNVISNRTIYETTNVLVYSQYSFTTNEYFNIYHITNYYSSYTSIYTNYFSTNLTYDISIVTNLYLDIYQSNIVYEISEQAQSNLVIDVASEISSNLLDDIATPIISDYAPSIISNISFSVSETIANDISNEIAPEIIYNVTTGLLDSTSYFVVSNNMLYLYRNHILIWREK